MICIGLHIRAVKPTGLCGGCLGLLLENVNELFYLRIYINICRSFLCQLLLKLWLSMQAINPLQKKNISETRIKECFGSEY